MKCPHKIKRKDEDGEVKFICNYHKSIGGDKCTDCIKNYLIWSKIKYVNWLRKTKKGIEPRRH